MTGRLEGIDLVIFDKDGTLIDFHAMWSDWAESLARDLEAGTGLAIRQPLFALLDYDETSGKAIAGGHLAATPMARTRDLVSALLVRLGIDPARAAGTMETAWHPPDPVALAYPVTDLGDLFGRLRASGRTIAVATSDDREPTVRTLTALRLDHLVQAIVCADDGLAVKPAPDAVLWLCERLSVAVGRTAVVGDSVADLAMGRAAGVARCYGVLTGVATRDALAASADEVLESVAALLEAG